MQLLALPLRLIGCAAVVLCGIGVTVAVSFGSVVPAASAAVAAYQPPGTPDPSVAGATTPFATYWAPAGTLGGGASVVSLTSASTSQFDSPQGEAAGHGYVALTGTGASVAWCAPGARFVTSWSRRRGCIRGQM